MLRNENAKSLVDHFKESNPIVTSDIISESVLPTDLSGSLSYADLLKYSKNVDEAVNQYHLGLLKLKIDIKDCEAN